MVTNILRFSTSTFVKTSSTATQTQTIVGWAVDDGGAGRGLRWTSSGVDDLTDLIGLSNFAIGGISSDGSTLLGGHRSTERGFAWSEQSGVQYLTAPSPLTSSPCRPHAASADGSVIVGEIFNVGSFRWTASTGVVRLEGPAKYGSAVATDVSEDGSIVVGRESAGSTSSPWIWDSTHGMRDLKQVLIDDYGLGASLAGWTFSGINVSISADGKTIVGRGVNSRGIEAFVAYLGSPVPEPSTPVLFAIGFGWLARLSVRAPAAPKSGRRGIMTSGARLSRNCPNVAHI